MLGTLIADPKLILLYLNLGEHIQQLAKELAQLLKDPMNNTIADWQTASRAYYELVEAFSENPTVLARKDYRAFTHTDKYRCSLLIGPDFVSDPQLRACYDLWRSGRYTVFPQERWDRFENTADGLKSALERAVTVCTEIDYDSLDRDLQLMTRFNAGTSLAKQVRSLLSASKVDAYEPELQLWREAKDIGTVDGFLFEHAVGQPPYPLATTGDFPELDDLFDAKRWEDRRIGLRYYLGGSLQDVTVQHSIRSEKPLLQWKAELETHHADWMRGIEDPSGFRVHATLTPEEFDLQRDLDLHPQIHAAFFHGDGRLLYLSNLLTVTQ